MIELLRLYKWTILSAAFAAPALALIGAQILARGWATRALIVSQGSSTGLICGLAALSFFEVSNTFTRYLGALTSSLIVSALAGSILVLFDRSESKRSVSNDPGMPSVLFSIYVGLIAIGMLITSISPHLEVSMSTAYIGDLSTVSDLESRLGLAISLGVSGWIWLKWRPLTRDAFEQFVLARVSQPKRQLVFTLISMIVLSVAMHAMGLVFVLGSLFVPFAVLGQHRSNLFRFRTELVLTSVTGTLCGFLLSLGSEILPTSPTIFACLALAGFTIRACRRSSERQSVISAN